MTRYERVQQILDEAVGGPTAPVGFHGAFWRNTTRDNFVVKKVLGLPLITLGMGAESNLIKALKGQTPFGADTGNPDADFNRMPSGREPVPDADIAFIQKWIDDGCPEDPFPAVGPLTWRKTNAPIASSRTDDIWFVNEKVGWAVNSDGNIIHTQDGGDTWNVQWTGPGVYLRCIGFANDQVGWVGTLSPGRRLLRTVDGGGSWTRVGNLPANAPVAVCGMSVVNESVVFASGTNRPADFPRVIKTTDGGANWTAIDMSAHASVLIDCYFTDASHGWVVGGKANEPTPTTRDKLKPVVLETTDGGATWVNRLAGQEGAFPLGEWGWKIQFLNASVGFVSLENFSAAAILKTTDGGRTWTRIKVNDPQMNVNLEGVGFIDERTGWVGGWGPGGFGQGGDPLGLSSATTDGGATWVNANEIGLRINRFRFFGSPVTAGYASGFTVYKYSSAPIPPAAMGVLAAPASRPLLPRAEISSDTLPIAIPLEVPVGAKRLTLRVWDWFGVDCGTILDEVLPHAGSRTFEWDGTDEHGNAVGKGDFIVRMTTDNHTASTTVSYRTPPARPAKPAALRAAAAARNPRFPAFAAPLPPRLRTVAALMREQQHDLEWLKNALQIAVQLEWATLPPYLTARWTIKDPDHYAAESVFEIRGEEMSHLGIACNLLVAIGGTPLFADPAVVPVYPGPLPGGVRPGLVVSLRKLSPEQAKVFMDIEYPTDGPIAMAMDANYNTIGDFYQAIRQAFVALNPPLTTNRQLSRSGSVRFSVLDTLAKVTDSIDLLLKQGEGSRTTPEESDGDLAHYYRFGELFHGRKLKQDLADGKWKFNGEELPALETWNMADIPVGGYQRADVPDGATWDRIVRFDAAYSTMLRKLQAAWTNGSLPDLRSAILSMSEMSDIAAELIQTPRPDGQGNYGPCFRFVSQ